MNCLIFLLRHLLGLPDRNQAHVMIIYYHLKFDWWSSCRSHIVAMLYVSMQIWYVIVIEKVCWILFYIKVHFFLNFLVWPVKILFSFLLCKTSYYPYIIVFSYYFLFKVDMDSRQNPTNVFRGCMWPCTLQVISEFILSCIYSIFSILLLHMDVIDFLMRNMHILRCGCKINK